MEFTGTLIGLAKDYASNEWRITFSVNEREALEAANELKEHPLSVVAKIFRKRRSIDANRLLWKCISDIAYAQHLDKWEVYLEKLKAHGKSYPVTIPAEAFETLKATWRECEAVGEWTDEFGVKRMSVICYPGSHLYNTEEFSHLLDDVIEDMNDLGLQPPTSEEMRRSLEEWEKHTQHSAQ